MKYKMLLPVLAAFAALFIPAAAVCAAEVTTSSPKPNVVFILADDLGYGDVHCLNPARGKIATPQMDKLAGQGMTFTEAHFTLVQHNDVTVNLRKSKPLSTDDEGKPVTHD